MRNLKNILFIVFATIIIPYASLGIAWYITKERVYGAIFIVLSVIMLLINIAMIVVNVKANGKKK